MKCAIICSSIGPVIPWTAPKSSRESHGILREPWHSIRPADLSASDYTAPFEPVYTPGQPEVSLFPEDTLEPPSSSLLFLLLGSLLSHLCPFCKPVLTLPWRLFWTPQPNVLPQPWIPPSTGGYVNLWQLSFLSLSHWSPVFLPPALELREGNVYPSSLYSLYHLTLYNVEGDQKMELWVIRTIVTPVAQYLGTSNKKKYTLCPDWSLYQSFKWHQNFTI